MAVKILSTTSKLMSARGVMLRKMWRRTLTFTCPFVLYFYLLPALATDPLAAIEKSVQLIDRGENSLARAYLAPVLIDPKITAAVRSRAYYLRGFAFSDQGLPVSALRDFNRALEFNPANPAALFALARLYWDGVGADQDEALAMELFAQAHELGHQDAELFLALGHLYGRGIPQDRVKGRSALQALAAVGNSLAMSHIAASLRATPAQPRQAAQWYRKAAAAGDPNALVALAYMHLGGELSTAAPLAAANALLQQAAAAGSAAALTRLAHHYMAGTGVTQDYARAFSLFLEASALGNSDAEVGLGYLLDAQLAPPSADRSAGYWYERAAMSGNAEGQLRWAQTLLEKGLVHQASTWFAAAARQNHVQGHNSLAWLLATHKDAEVRNGRRAVAHAQSAVAAQPSPEHLDTLAAAYAENGQFELAVATQLRALEALTESSANIEAELRQRLQQYRRLQPWRQ